MADQCKMENEEDDLSADIKDWSKHQVRQWALKEVDVDPDVADILFQQNIKGANLLLFDYSKLSLLGIPFGPSDLIIHARDELLNSKKEQLSSPTNQPGRPCKPYPFHRHHDACRYKANSILDIAESGASDYIEPCHEYKAYIYVNDENKMIKFKDEVIRFAAACMNSRTNGTIHFGIGDKPEFTHGQVLGVDVKDKEAYENTLKHAIEGHFEHKHIQAAKMCIKPPRFVEVLNSDMTSSEKYVIEVDIVPDSTICKDNIYHTFAVDTRKAKKKTKGKDKDGDETKECKQLFVRDGSSSRDLVPTSHGKPNEFERFVDKLTQLLQLREQAEQKHLGAVRSSSQGSRLSEMITGGSQSLDKSYFERYVIVTNKSHPVQLESLAFLLELNPTAVLDFDPESAKNGLQRHFEEQCKMTVHLPAEYKITEAIEDIAKKLKLTRNTSWVFCNGGINGEAPSDVEHWSIDKGASVRDVISFLCRKDVLPPKRFLIIFLLLSTVNEKMDPLLEAFNTFMQALNGTEQILCVCENERVSTSWKDLLEARYGINISGRCIYELSFAEVKGTVLSLLSKNRKSSRFLPCLGGGKVLLEKKAEGSLHTLDILCENQCEGGNEDKVLIEENFYKGGKVSWWNFYFSEQPGSMPFIKRDKFDFIMDTVIPDLMSLRKACVSFTLMHIAGCGGTTLAMHILWALRHKFRCAVLKDSDIDPAEAATQVVELLTYHREEHSPRIPVLLMIDDFDDMDKVYDLQQLIDKECVKRNLSSATPQVILLNCMRAESEWQQTESTENTVFIGNCLSEMEQRQFALSDVEKTYKNADTFYGFMIMKKNFKPEYIQGVAHNTLKGFNVNQKSAQLFTVLVLLNVYGKRASLSVPLCEEFLGLQPKPYCGSSRIEDGFGKLSTLITSCSVEAQVVFNAVRMIHPSMAEHCLKELATHGVTKFKILDLLLTTDKLYECIQGKSKLARDVRNMLLKRNFSIKGQDSQFSPLIQHIAKETPGEEANVLLNAAKLFEKDAFISQLLARYHYLKRQDFKEAKQWAEKAKDLSRNNSYIMDTAAQVIKHELKNAIAKEKDAPINHEKLRDFLKMAQSACAAFGETQLMARKESTQRLRNKRDNSPFNTAGCLGEIQVAVIIIEILRKTPVFSSGNVRHDILSEILSGNIKVEAAAMNDPKYRTHSPYYKVLKQFEELLSSLRCHMKAHFDFLDRFHVNLSPRFKVKDRREVKTRIELFRCFQVYVDLFCNTESKELLKNENMVTMLKVHQSRQFLEMHKADTHYGILNHLSDGIPAGRLMETIVQYYDFILRHSIDHSVKERVNFIYANLALSCIKPSEHLVPYQVLVGMLCKVLQGQIPSDDTLAVHFIAVALLWPQQSSLAQPIESMRVGRYMSQMKTSFRSEMQSVYNGKRPVVHFFLGKQQGYGRLKPLGEIEGCVGGRTGQEEIASMWENGKIWKERKIEQLLCMATGVVRDNMILASTFNRDIQIEVIPMFRSQLSGRASGSTVSFFVGFSMRGPLAIDIH